MTCWRDERNKPAERGGYDPSRCTRPPTAGYKTAAPPRRGPLSGELAGIAVLGSFFWYNYEVGTPLISILIPRQSLFI